jgi:hypothetical protein
MVDDRGVGKSAAGWEQVRGDLLRLAKSRTCRSTAFTPKVPCDWSPQSVWDTRFGMLFTSEGAWNYIIELLESGHQFTSKAMKTPPNTIAYETVIDRGSNLPPLYIKLQILGGRILGRSFHNSVK